MIKDFWQRVNKLIKAQKTKQEAVADTCEINIQTFRGWISKNIFPNALQAQKIAKSLNTTVEYLVTGKYANSESMEAAALRDKLARIESICKE